jgi:hypothetical protein
MNFATYNVCYVNLMNMRVMCVCVCTHARACAHTHMCTAAVEWLACQATEV